MVNWTLKRVIMANLMRRVFMLAAWIFVAATTEPPKSSGHFHVTQDRKATYDDKTDSWHVTLSCGQFVSLGHPAVDVLWQTPSGDTKSTSYDHGQFYLQLPNPVEGGNYTCALPSTYAATSCLPAGSPLSREAALLVDETKARLTLLEAENTDLKTLVKSLGNRAEALAKENDVLKNQTDSFEHLMKQKTDSLQQKLDDATATLEPPKSSGHFHVTQDRKATYDDKTDSWHVTLSCGQFVSLGHPAVDVLWQTPSGDTKSTSYDHGQFYLQLPNPVEGGNYTCALPSTYAATSCLPAGSPLSREAALLVDETKARLTLLEAENTDLKTLVKSLGNRAEALAKENDVLKNQTDSFEHLMKQKTDSLQQKLDDATATLGKHNRFGEVKFSR
ncbi:hypothetical protein BaRGS_00035894, partial [Batillaria attramentaria]